ncbi:glycosyltransferase family 2 protein [Lysobacter korlensis]|uniref:Glycosyltransferase family 2 protein n=1 Tax=Lysobacter korlensis TaxID=553636 RepID=A0ABV6RY59_9GAMM
MQRISVIICNYNYADFVGRSIDSALALEWPDVEVIVVDNGSTDSSREVIAGFGSRIRVLLQENMGQRVASNNGFAMSTGDVVMFLDSDDMLVPSLAPELAKIWRPGVSKVQFQLKRVDSQDRPLGSVFPKYRTAPSPDEIRRWAEETTAYPTPPGSGNAYARSFLERIFPLDDSTGQFSDSACLAAAPFLGDVLTIPQPLGLYRVHGRNDSNLLNDPSRFRREVERARARYLFSTRVRGNGRAPADERPLRRSRELLQLRIAAVRLSPEPPGLPGDTRARMLWDAVRSPLHPGPEDLTTRLLIAAWSVVTLIAPRPLARRLIRRRYNH